MMTCCIFLTQLYETIMVVKCFITLVPDAAAQTVNARDAADDGPGVQEVRLVEVEVRRPQGVNLINLFSSSPMLQ